MKNVMKAAGVAMLANLLMLTAPAFAQTDKDGEGQHISPESGAKTNSTTKDSNDVLKASNAREIARVTCTTKGSCFSPDTRTAIGQIRDNFNGTLLDNSGRKNSALALGAKAFLLNSDLWPKSIPYAILHLVSYDAKQQIHDKWLLAKWKKPDGHDAGSAIDISEDTHIPGVKRIALVFLHLDVVYEPKATGDASDERKALDELSNISYRAIVEKKLPINIQNLLSVLKLASFQAESKKQQADIAGGGVIDHVDIPSDVTVFGLELGDNSRLIGMSQKYDNEGKYFWDVSVGVPINKLTLLDYSSDNGVYTPKTINKQSVYALINFYPDLVDLKYGNAHYYLPRIVAGIGVTGRPGENFMFGGAWGIKQLQFFVGSAFANHNLAPAGTTSTTGNNIKQRYSSHLTYGINVPIVDALKKLASGKSGK